MPSQNSIDSLLMQSLAELEEQLSEGLEPAPWGSTYSEMQEMALERYPEVNPVLIETMERMSQVVTRDGKMPEKVTLKFFHLESKPCVRCPLADWRARGSKVTCTCSGVRGEEIYSGNLATKTEEKNATPDMCTEYLRSCQVWPPTPVKKLSRRQVERDIKSRELEEDRGRTI